MRLLVVGDVPRLRSRHRSPARRGARALHREPGIERLALRGLGDDELLTLLEATAGHELAEEGVALRDALSAETDGNPFFVGEMVRHLAETGPSTRTSSGRWVASPDLRTSGLPISIREVIGRRVARLGDPDAGCAVARPRSSAATSTPRCSPGSPSSTRTASSTCATAAVDAAVLTGSPWRAGYTFAHALIEHALYDDLSSGRRGRAHRAVAEALEEICGDDPGRPDRTARVPLGSGDPAAGRRQGDGVRATGGRSGAGAARARRGAALVPGCARSAGPGLGRRSTAPGRAAPRVRRCPTADG